MRYDFKSVCEELVNFCQELGRIPKKIEIDNNPKLPSNRHLREIFMQNKNMKYNDYCESIGYFNSKHNFFTFESLLDSWEKFFNKYERYPNTSDYCNAEFNIPSFSTIKKTLGDRWNEFFNIFHEKEKMLFRIQYDKTCADLLKYCIENKHVPTKRELTKLGFPQAQWFTKHSQDDEIKSYSDILESLGIKPHYNISKETAIQLIFKKANSLGRNLTQEDFANPSHDEIGRKVVDKYWGTFNNMLKDLGFEINQESMTDRSKPIEELKKDIIRLCNYIEETENRRLITFNDINDCAWCLDTNTYDKHFKEKLNISLVQFINDLGYQTNKCGMGMVFQFDDGEITTSQFEYKVSKYLRSKNYNYLRNYPYQNIQPSYNGKKDCDYVIELNSGKCFVEIAGMLDYTKVSKNKDDFIRQKYKVDLEEKEKMLQSANLNYRIIYPEELQKKSIEDVFSFLVQ